MPLHLLSMNPVVQALGWGGCWGDQLGWGKLWAVPLSLGMLVKDGGE